MDRTTQAIPAVKDAEAADESRRAAGASSTAPVAQRRALIQVRLDSQWLVVWIVWIWMTIDAWMYVKKYAARIPMWDDLELVPLLSPKSHWTIQELWAQSNEHRLPLPRVIEVGLYGATGDVRTPMFVEVVLLAAISLAAILVARKLRGRTSVVDAVFPLLWLHTGNHENLLMAFQISIVLPTVLVCAMILVAVTRERRGFGPLEASFFGLCLLALPMCGGQGMAQGAVLGAGLVVAAAVSRRQPERKLRRGSIVLLVFLALTAVLGVLYLVGFQYPPDSPRTHDITAIVLGGMRCATLAFGLAGPEWWPWSGVAVMVLIVATSVLLALAWRKHPEDRMRVGALAFGMAAAVVLCLWIGFGRSGLDPGAVFAVRYVPFPSPIVLVAALAWTLYGARASSWLVPGAVAITLLVANVNVNTPRGEEYGLVRRDMEAEFESDIHAGMGPAQFTQKWATRIHPAQTRLFILVREMAEMRLHPFDSMPDPLLERYTWDVTNLPPARIEAERDPAMRRIGNAEPVLLMPYPCAMHFDPPSDITRVSGNYGIPDPAIDRGQIGGLRVIISSSEADGTERTVLHDLTIDPARRPSERGKHEFDVALPANHHHVVFEVRWPDGAPHGYDWAFLGDLYFH